MFLRQQPVIYGREMRILPNLAVQQAQFRGLNSWTLFTYKQYNSFHHLTHYYTWDSRWPQPGSPLKTHHHKNPSVSPYDQRSCRCDQLSHKNLPMRGDNNMWMQWFFVSSLLPQEGDIYVYPSRQSSTRVRETFELNQLKSTPSQLLPVFSGFDRLQTCSHWFGPANILYIFLKSRLISSGVHCILCLRTTCVHDAS